MAAGDLMDVRLRAGTRRLTLTLAPDGPDGLAATLDETVHRVGPVSAGPRAAAAGGTTVEELALEIDGRPVRAVVARRPDRVLVSIAGRAYVFDLGEESGAAQHGGGGSGAVMAPMPGKVVSVLVQPGDTVEAGAAVVVLEAMKMETTLTADVAGRVATVQAVAGALVDAGALLVEITPAREAATDEA